MSIDWLNLGGRPMPVLRGLLSAVLLSLLGVAAMSHPASANILHGAIEQYDLNVDYFPDKVQVQHTTGFTVSYHHHYKVVTVRNPWRHATQTFQYVLVLADLIKIFHPELVPDHELIWYRPLKLE